MSNFNGTRDNGFDKGYLDMVVRDIEAGNKIKFGDGESQKINVTDDIKAFIKAVKERDERNLNKVMRIGTTNKFSPIFNGYPWTKIDKSPYSGQGGSGAGARITALGECFQAYMCAARQKKGSDLNSWLEGVDLLDSTTISTYTDCDRTLKQCLADLDEAWKNSGCVVANKIFNRLDAVKYVFHRGGRTVGKIEDAYKKLKKTAGITFDVNKWNPADIWVMKKSFTLDTNHDTLDDFNEYILKEHRSNNLLGISLKKLDSGATSCTEEVFNDGTPRPKATFLRHAISGIGKNSDWLTSYRKAGDASKDVYFTYRVGRKEVNMQIRTFDSGMTGWQGEIKGKSAAGGKIGGGNLQSAMVLAGIPTTKFKNQSEFKRLSKTNNEKTVAEFTKMYNKLSDSTMTEDEMSLFLRDYTNNWLYSKYLSMQFIYLLVTEKKEDEVVSIVVSIAESATPKSSIFIKYS